MIIIGNVKIGLISHLFEYLSIPGAGEKKMWKRKTILPHPLN